MMKNPKVELYESDIRKKFDELGNMHPFEKYRIIIREVDRNEATTGLKPSPEYMLALLTVYQTEESRNEVVKSSSTLHTLSSDESNLFYRLPQELKIKIASLTSNPDAHSEEASDKIAVENFRPSK